MKRILLSGVAFIAVAAPALAADLLVKAVPRYVPPPPVFSWTGFYIGFNGGRAAPAQLSEAISSALV